MVGAAEGVEHDGVGARRVLVEMLGRRAGPRPCEELELLGGVEGRGAEDPVEEGLGERESIRLEIPGTGDG